MPSPVSPGPGVPEHQPGQYRRPQDPNGPPPHQGPSNVQFPSDARAATGPFGSGRARSGQFGRPDQPGQPGQPGPPDQSGQPDQPDQPGSGDGKGGGRRDWLWSGIAFLVAVVVIGAVAFYFFGPRTEEEPAAEWAVDSCAAPSAPAADASGEGPTEFRPMSCDDPEAMVTILEIQDAVSVGQAHCPAGTDVVFQKEGKAGGATRAVCARNLSDDHPGDPGMGGGQLLTGDCVDEAGSEVACSSDGARKVVGLIFGTNECPENSTDTIELGFDAYRSYEAICLGKS